MQQTTLPIVDTFNIKRIVIEGLEAKLKEIGPLRVPVVVSVDYPSSTSNSINDSGDTVSYRRVVVKRKSTVVNKYAIGDVYSGASNLHQHTLNDNPYMDDGLVTVVGEGWYEDHTLEISVWSRDANDRDNLLELLRMFMLELNHRNLENGAPYFYNNRVYAVKFSRAYEMQDTKIIADNVHYVGVLEYVLSAPVYGTTIEHYEKVKFELIGELDKNIDKDKDPGKDKDKEDNSSEIVIIIDKPKTPWTSPTDSTVYDPKNPEQIHTHKEGNLKSHKENPEVLYVGGPLRTDGGALIEQIFKEVEEED